MCVCVCWAHEGPLQEKYVVLSPPQGVWYVGVQNMDRDGNIAHYTISYLGTCFVFISSSGHFHCCNPHSPVALASWVPRVSQRRHLLGGDRVQVQVHQRVHGRAVLHQDHEERLR